MLISKTLPNIGYIIDDVPEKLFFSLKEECEIANKARYDTLIKKEIFISGLTSKGVTKHYYLQKNLDEFFEFIFHMCSLYQKEFPDYMSKLKILSNNVPFYFQKPWINIQEKYEYLPIHSHDGVFSYVIWMKIPYDINQEIKNEHQKTSKFEFIYNDIVGNICNFDIPIDSNYEGKIMMFPSSLNHCVYPFCSSNENRISISGNILLDTTKYIST